ncbi:MAG: HPr family phosphocarrier protein [Elusimicrobia bacterium]|nr:HPr family phosphocarrier protein [Elusimicrobiota bacterium]
MIDLDFDLKWRIGLRTACLITSTAAKFTSKITLSHGGQTANARIPCELALLDDLKAGAPCRLVVEGTDEWWAMAAVGELFTLGDFLDRCPHRDCPSTLILTDYSELKIYYACSNGHAWEVRRTDAAAVKTRLLEPA